MLTLTFLNVYYTYPHALNNYGMWLSTPTLLHVFNDWGFDTLKRKIEGSYKIISLESGLGLIHMNNYPLDPLSCGSLTPMSSSLPIYNWRYILFYYFRYRMFTITSLGPQPYIIFTLYIFKPGIKNGDVTFPSPYNFHFPSCTTPYQYTCT